MLSDFFHPLSPALFFSFSLLLLYFDVLGSAFIKRVLKIESLDENRVINWLVGLGLYVFIWFLLGLFISPQRPQILLVTLLSLPIIIPGYSRPRVLFHLKGFLIPLFVIIPFIPAVFVKSSLPPYFGDEMAYHFISPSQLQNLSSWKFGSGFYENLPRLMETYYTLTFSVFRTYSIARLTNFVILITAILYAYKFLQSELNKYVAIFFVLIFFAIPHQIVFNATVGLVDVPTYSFITIAVLFGVGFIISRRFENILLSSVFWGMAVGAKYSALTALLAFSFTLFIFILRSWSVFKPLQFIKKIPLFLTIFLIFGGYWYLKNLVATGNPVYPFIFPCYRYTDQCPLKSEYFASWTIPVSWQTIPEIIGQMFVKIKFWPYFIATLLLVLPNNNSRTRQISFFLIILAALELVLLKRFSGFLIRYHQHLQIILFLLISLQLANSYRWIIWRFGSKLAYAGLAIILFINLRYHLRLTYRSDVLPTNEVNYALKKNDIYTWIKSIFPRAWPIIEWCEKDPSSQSLPLVKIDPDVIWYQDDGKASIFMTNCQILPRSDYFSDSIPLSEVIPSLVKSQASFRLISLNPCLPDSQVTSKDPREGEYELHLRRINNIIVCKSRPLSPPNLYEFNYITPDSGIGRNPKSG